MLVILRGPVSSGKSTFARNFFQDHQIVSSDKIRQVLYDDINFMLEHDKVFELRDHIVRERLRSGLLTVADNMNLKMKDVKNLIQIANETFSDFIIISFDCNGNKELYEERLIKRNEIGEQFISIEEFHSKLERYNNSTQYFKEEFGDKFIEGQYDKESDRFKMESAPFNFVQNRFVSFVDSSLVDYWLIGDIHACSAELEQIIQECIEHSKKNNKDYVFYSMGDIIDRGPDPIGTFEICKKYNVILIQGNHEYRYIREFIYENAKKRSNSRKLTHEQIKEYESYLEFVNYIGSTIHFKVLADKNSLNVAVLSHAGMCWSEIERFVFSSFNGHKRILLNNIPKRFGYSNTIEEFGSPYMDNYRQYFGHRYHQYEELNSKNIKDKYNINLDSGVVYGKYLTAVNAFTNEIIKINAAKVYYE